MTDTDTKYYKIIVNTNIKEHNVHPAYSTSSKYLNADDIKCHITNCIYRLELSRYTKISDIKVCEITKAESQKLPSIDKLYKPLIESDKKMIWGAEEERLRMQGVKHIKLDLFFKKLDKIFDYSDDE